MAKVVTTFISDDDDMLASIAKMNAEIDKLKENANNSARTGGAGFSDMAASVAKATAAIGAGFAALKIFNRELEHKNQLEAQSLSMQKGTAGSEREFAMNLGLVSDADRAKAFAGMTRIGRKTGVNVDDLYAVGAAGLSASGGNLDKMLEATELAAKTAPGNVQTMDELASAMLHLEKATGSSDLKKNLTFLIGLGQVSPVKDWAQLSTNLTPGAIGVSGYGGTAAETGSLLATLSNAMGDTRGDQAKTAGIALAEALEKFKPDLGSTADRIAAMQAAGESEVDRFFNTPGISFEKVAKVPIRRLLTAGTNEAKMFAENTATLDQMLQTDKTGEFFAGLDASNLQATASADRGATSAYQRFMLTQGKQSQEAWARKTFDELLDVMGVGSTGQAFMLSQMDVRAFGGVESKQHFLSDQVLAYTRSLKYGEDGNERELNSVQKEQLHYLSIISQQLQTMNSRPANGNPPEDN